ncbi:hypothetical protein O9992_25465 [Vibrio lentus]|nr:hypothetical protein [Vibrio lentus]
MESSTYYIPAYFTENKIKEIKEGAVQLSPYSLGTPLKVQWTELDVLSPTKVPTALACIKCMNPPSLGLRLAQRVPVHVSVP